MIWTVPKVWDGEEVWIIGGGPSMPRQFGIPEDIIKKVISGELFPSAYSPYMEGIHGKHVIGINVAYLIGDWIDLIFFGDHSFFKNHQEGLSNFPGLKVSCHPQMAKVPWVKYVPLQPGRRMGLSTEPNMLVWNGNSGAASLSVACNTGVKRIILLGFDMAVDFNTKMQHWHDLYGKGRIDDPKNTTKLPFGKHKIGFNQIALDAKARGIEIINVSPDSEIKHFRRATVKELL